MGNSSEGDTIGVVRVKKTRPPDGGWGWMVTAGCYVIMALLSMLTLCYSILFSRFLLDEGASTTTTTWILNSHLFLHNMSGLFVGPLIKEFGFRKLCLFGAVGATLCFLALIYIKSILYFFLLFSTCGIFVGLTYKPCFLILPLYFDRRRGLSNAFLMAGVCSAQFIGPPLIGYLLNEYALHGAILVLGAIFLNSIAAASLFHPVEWYMKPVEDENEDVETRCEDDRRCDTDYDTEGECEDVEGSFKHKTMKQDLLAKQRQMLRLSQYSTSSLSLAASQIDLTAGNPLNSIQSKEEETSMVSRSTGINKVLRTVNRVFRSVLSDITILKSRRASIIVFGGICSYSAYINFLVLAPFAIQAAGYTLSDAAWCVSISAITNFIARLITSTLSDCRWFNMRVFYMLGATIMAVSTCAFGFLTELVWMKVMIGIWGYGMGMTISLYILLMPKYMGLEKMSAIFGAQSLCLGFAFIIFGPLLGVIRDYSDSYLVAMIATGMLVCVCVIMWCFMPAAVESDRKKELKQQQQQLKQEQQQQQQQQQLKQEQQQQQQQQSLIQCHGKEKNEDLL